MRYVLGVDGGQSSTLAVVAATTGEVCAARRGGPANHLDEPGGPERLRRSLEESVGRAIDAAGLRGQDLAAACFGMTGSGALVPDFLPGVVAPGRVERLRVESDAVTALAGATTGRPGAIVIAGTGSVAFAVSPTGERLAVGGWGYLMGDEGSGYDVAIHALRAATQAADGRGPATSLVAAIPAHFGLPDLRALHRAIYSGRLDRPRIAEIARVVGDAAGAGDGPARAILAAAGADLALAVATALRRLDCLGAELPVAPVGGLCRAGPPLLEPFGRELARLAPHARVQPPDFPPVIGAVLLALQDAGEAGPRPPAPLLARLRAGLAVIAGTEQPKDSGGSA